MSANDAFLPKSLEKSDHVFTCLGVPGVQLFMDSYEDYAERAKLMTTVHAKRKSAAAAEVDERAAEERSGALAGAKGPNGEAKENEKGANAGSGKFVTKAADKASKEAQKQKEVSGPRWHQLDYQLD